MTHKQRIALDILTARYGRADQMHHCTGAWGDDLIVTYQHGSYSISESGQTTWLCGPERA